MNAFTIRDLENLSGIKAHTIRIWEQRYTFLKPQRSTTNIRYYDADELKKLLNIALLNKYGFKISHIDKMGDDAIREKILSLNSIEAQQERMINSLLKGMIDLETAEFEMILDEHISLYGIDKTITTLMFPFLQRIGILWMTDHVRVAQEHLVSNIVRQKLIMGIENVPGLLTSPRTAVLFLPEGEYHELGLLYVHYLLKVRGLKIIYLGADVPVEELEYVCRVRKPDFLYTHMTSLPVKFSFEKFLSSMQKCSGDTSVLMSGKITHGYDKKIPAGIIFKKTLDEVITHLAGNSSN